MRNRNRFYQINFEAVGQKGQCKAKESLLECTRRLNIGIYSVCGGRGTCHTCRIKTISGKLSRLTRIELKNLTYDEIAEGWRLACQAKPLSDCRIMLHPESIRASQRICLEGLNVPITPEPPVKSYALRLAIPSLSDQRSDADRLLQSLKKRHGRYCESIDRSILRSLSPKLRAWNWKCSASIRDKELVALYPQKIRPLGLAIDLGTTTIAGYLIDLNSGHTLVSEGMINPQVKYGEDIINRINHAIKSTRECHQLQKLVVSQLNELAARLCSSVNEETDNIVEAVVVGNSAMHHLLIGAPVKQLALTPFVPAVSMPLDIKAREFGVKIAAGAYIHFPPLVGGFIGSDHLSMLLANEALSKSSPVIMLDIGTNTEISLVNGEKITSTSCASGPAFEGGHIKHGMRAVKGAIERLQISSDVVNFQTIGNAQPIGLCGSGILDALAQMYLTGVIDGTGRLVEDHHGVRINNKQAEFTLIGANSKKNQPEIVVTQKDIRELQLAKAAIRTGLQLLLEANGLTEKQVKQIIIGGAFGSYVNLSSAITSGLVPPLPLDYFRQVGNAAGLGAKMALLSLSKRKKSQDILSHIHYIELADNPDFQRTFITASRIGRYWIVKGKREVLADAKELG